MAQLAVVLYQPEIPDRQRREDIMNLLAVSRLHLVQPLGFSLRDKQLQRAGLDYGTLDQIEQHADWRGCRDALAGRRLFMVTTRAARLHHEPLYREDDVLVFGPETRGLPQAVLEECPPARRLRIPMRPGNRSLNLSNAAAVVVYEAWRQRGFFIPASARGSSIP